MSIFNQFPYTNVHEMNLDWVIKTVKNALENVEDVVTEYFADHLDSTLSDPNKAAQAAATGFRLSGVEGGLDAQSLRIDTLEQQVTAGQFAFTLSKSDDTLKYNDIVTSSGDVPQLYELVQSGIPVRISVDGDPLYRAKISGDDVVLYKDVPEYECTIAKNAVQGSAAYVGFVRVNAVSLKYIEGTYESVNQFRCDKQSLFRVDCLDSEDGSFLPSD